MTKVERACLIDLPEKIERLATKAAKLKCAIDAMPLEIDTRPLKKEHEALRDTIRVCITDAQNQLFRLTELSK